MANYGERTVLIGRSFRAFHVFLILGSGLLLLSALGSDDGREVITGSINMFLLHRYAGLAWGAIVLIYGLISILRRKRLEILEPLRRPIMEQIVEAFSVIGRYFFGRRISDRVRRKMGRHNVLAAYAFVLMATGIVFLGIGGIGLIATQHDTISYEIYLGIHVLGAGMLILFVLAHVFAVINRENRPLLKAVFTDGKVRSHWAAEQMPEHRDE